MTISETYNEDCMALMARYPDKHFDLAVVDPPYGIGWDAMQNGKWGEGKIINGWKRQYRDYKKVEWDIAPSEDYFKELFRVSSNQIIWGANHFVLPPSKCYIFWDKLTGKFSFGDGELAWCSIGGSIKKFTFRWAGMLKGENGNYKETRIHPTQKPIALYSWIFANYAKPGQLILDTHLGSGSSRIAADKAGLNFVGCELDADYFEAQEKRWREYKMQLKMF